MLSVSVFADEGNACPVVIREAFAQARGICMLRQPACIEGSVHVSAGGRTLRFPVDSSDRRVWKQRFENARSAFASSVECPPPKPVSALSEGQDRSDEWAAPSVGISAATRTKNQLSFIGGGGLDNSGGFYPDPKAEVRLDYARAVVRSVDLGIGATYRMVAEPAYAGGGCHGTLGLHALAGSAFARIRLWEPFMVTIGLRPRLELGYGTSRAAQYLDFDFCSSDDWSRGALFSRAGVDLLLDLRLPRAVFSFALLSGGHLGRLTNASSHAWSSAIPIVGYTVGGPSVGASAGVTIAVLPFLALAASIELGLDFDLTEQAAPVGLRLTALAGPSFAF